MKRSQLRLYSYVVKSDAGHAPNPFWGYCTLAICTPNHMGIRAEKGDWIMGTTSASRGRKLVYAMQISERLCFDDYYKDSRFQKKKPVIYGTWQQQCGDNMYYRDGNDMYRQIKTTLNHTEKGQQKQDTKHPYVFISEHFYYFGGKAVEIPLEYTGLIWVRHGCKRNHNPETVHNFLNWLQDNFEPGKHGEPCDNSGCYGQQDADQAETSRKRICKPKPCGYSDKLPQNQLSGISKCS